MQPPSAVTQQSSGGTSCKSTLLDSQSKRVQTIVPTTQSTPSEAFVAEFDSAQRALKDVWLQILCGLSCRVSQPSSWSRIVLHEQHSER